MSAPSNSFAALRARGFTFQQAETYARDAANLEPLGLTVTLEMLDDLEEIDGGPLAWAQVDHPSRPAIYQGPARDLARWVDGLGWGLFLAAASEAKL